MAFLFDRVSLWRSAPLAPLQRNVLVPRPWRGGKYRTYLESGTKSSPPAPQPFSVFLRLTPTLAHTCTCTNSLARTLTPIFSLSVLCLLCFTYLKPLLSACWWVPVADIYRASAPLETSPLGTAEPQAPLPMSPWMSKDGSLNPELLPTPGIWCEAPAMREAATLMETPPESTAGGRL